MKVEFTVLGRLYTKYQSEYEEAVLRILRSGWYILGNELTKFENDFAAYHGVKHCAGVGNGLDALCFAVSALGIGPGDEVIVQANTYIATALAVSETGAIPVFVEADKFFGIDPEGIEKAITEKTKSIMAVHLYGQPCNMDQIMEIGNKHNLHVIEDCAQAHGAKYKGKLVGTFGDAGCFSFYPTKPVGAMGDAGAVITNSNELDDKVRMIRNYGSKVKYKHEIIGINSRMDEIQAAVTCVALKHIEEGNGERRAIAQKYLDGIKNPKVVLPDLRPDSEHVYHVFAVLCEERDRLHDFLEENNIHAQIHYPIPCHLAGCYSSLGSKSGKIPTAESFAKQELSLPIYVGMPEDEVDYVIETINRFK
ncbi:DegT/DnrJ/EryC1/StrS family aminotransferase [Pelotomaculum propionicicum]|uniref:DegT/DnrJ/EryC1/StrS family aminotransferase n=1 Tax=Pelotomaculum propionicicum TaxID=258475 RepID=UPI003B7BBB1B